MNLSFQMLDAGDEALIKLIAGWYAQEWNLPEETTVKKLSSHSPDSIPFQIVMKDGDIPVATGGIYPRVSLVEQEPRFLAYGPWLALVYTLPERRNQGLGALLCTELEARGLALGLDKIYLFTYSAESLYLRLGWQAIERLTLKGRELVVMEKSLAR